MNATTLTEHVTDWHADLAVDRQQRLIRNIALAGRTSRNGYRYSEQALQDAVALYEHKPVFLDHAGDRTRPHVRSARDLVGSIVHPRYEDGRIRGDIRVLDTETGRTFLALAQSNPPGVGMSHVVLAERRTAGRDGSNGCDGRGGGGDEVAKIHDVVSVDAVVFPATTTTFRESHTPAPPCEQAPAPADASGAGGTASGAPGAAAHPPHDDDDAPEEAGRSAEVASKEGDAVCETERLRSALQQLLYERNELLARLESLQQCQDQRRREGELDALLQAAGLPACVITESFRAQLLAADEPARRQLLDDRRIIVERLRREHPRSAERSGEHDTARERARFISAIRRHR